MKFTVIYIVILLLPAGKKLSSQTPALQKIDRELSGIYKRLMVAPSANGADSLARLFKKQLLKHLQHRLTFQNDLDSLSGYISIRISADKRIRFYSWDEYTGGSWHTITSVAQYLSPKGKPLVQLLSSGQEGMTGSFTDGEIYAVYNLQVNGKTYYLSFAWGTHGGGRQYQLIRLFSFEKRKLKSYSDVFPAKTDPVIIYPGTEKANLHYNPGTQEISFDEFIEDEAEGLYQRTGKRIVLKLMNGKFVSI